MTKIEKELIERLENACQTEARITLRLINKLRKENQELKEENQQLKDDQLWSEATIEGLKERFIPKERIENKIKEYEEMLKTLNKKSDTDRIKAINERIIGYKELFGF